MDRWRQIHDEGYAAGRAGRLYTANPYRDVWIDRFPAGVAWDVGWRGGQLEVSRLKEMAEALREGESGRRRGEPITANPYSERTHESRFHGWDEGWRTMDRRMHALKDLPDDL